MPIVVTNRGIVFADGDAYRLRCNDGYGALSSARPEALIDDAGALLLATTMSIQRTRDQGCNFEPSKGLPIDDPDASLDLTLGGFSQDPARPERALTSTQSYKTPAQLFVSEDFAHTWTPLATNATYSVYRDLLIAEDGQHVMAAGQRYDDVAKKLLSIFAVSSDGGRTWTDGDLPATRAPLGFLPDDSAVAFAREEILNRTIDPADKLLRSSDGGKTFTPVGDEWPTLGAFAATPDGSHIWLGARFGGLFVSTDRGASFRRLLEDRITGVDCLYFRQGVLWACANMAPNTDGIWTSSDLGATFQKKLTFDQVTQQVQCADMEVCELPWRDWEYELINGWNSLDGGSSAPPDASVDASALDAGLPDAAAPADAGSSSPSTRDDGCRVAGGRSSDWFALLLLALLARRRR